MFKINYYQKKLRIMRQKFQINENDAELLKAIDELIKKIQMEQMAMRYSEQNPSLKNQIKVNDLLSFWIKKFFLWLIPSFFGIILILSVVETISLFNRIALICSLFGLSFAGIMASKKTIDNYPIIVQYFKVKFNLTNAEKMEKYSNELAKVEHKFISLRQKIVESDQTLNARNPQKNCHQVNLEQEIILKDVAAIYLDNETKSIDKVIIKDNIERLQLLRKQFKIAQTVEEKRQIEQEMTGIWQTLQSLNYLYQKNEVPYHQNQTRIRTK